MSTPPNPLPRFLPTLTEVVRPSALVESTAPVEPTEDALVASVMHRIEALMAQRFAQEWDLRVENALSAHLNVLQDQLRLEFYAAARQMVSEEMALYQAFYKPKS